MDTSAYPMVMQTQTKGFRPRDPHRAGGLAREVPSGCFGVVSRAPNCGLPVCTIPRSHAWGPWRRNVLGFQEGVAVVRPV